MRRAILSPILSALVIPGLGQLINRQVGKGAFLVASASLLFMGGLGFFLFAFSKAVAELEARGALKPGDFGALAEQMRSDGAWWPWVFLALLFCLWLYGVIDAYRGGRKRDAELAKLTE